MADFHFFKVNVLSCTSLFSGVPQGTILSPHLFASYILSLRQIVHGHAIDFTQLYISPPVLAPELHPALCCDSLRGDFQHISTAK